MGRSTTPTFRVEYHDNPFAPVNLGLGTCMAWDTKGWGRPTAANLEKWRNKMNESFAAGGCNEHVSDARGYVVRISHARIVRQSNRDVVVEYAAPMFEAA